MTEDYGVGGKIKWGCWKKNQKKSQSPGQKRVSPSRRGPLKKVKRRGIRLTRRVQKG